MKRQLLYNLLVFFTMTCGNNNIERVMLSWTLLPRHLHFPKTLVLYQLVTHLSKCFLMTFLPLSSVQSPLQSIKEAMKLQP